MIHVVSVSTYGDCIITLSLLEQVAARGISAFHVIGTPTASAVSALLRTPLPVTETLRSPAAFYAFRANGFRRSLADMQDLRRHLERLTQKGDTLALERADLRTSLVIPRGRRVVCAANAVSAYSERLELMRLLFGDLAAWPTVPVPTATVQRVLINPCARFSDRHIAPEVVSRLLSLASHLGWSVTLLDPCFCYATLRGRVERYERRLDLPSAAALLRGSDFFLGPDSFFLHLAYYYRIPSFGFFPRSRLFLLPGMERVGNFIGLDQLGESAQLEQRLCRVVTGSST